MRILDRFRDLRRDRPDADNPDRTRLSTDLRTVEQGFWPKVKGLLGRVSFLETALAAYYCAMDPKTPKRVRLILLAALAYFVVPLDMIPDLLTFIGFTDDLSVLMAAIAAVSSEITDEHREKARQKMEEFR